MKETNFIYTRAGGGEDFGGGGYDSGSSFSSSSSSTSFVPTSTGGAAAGGISAVVCIIIVIVIIVFVIIASKKGWVKSGTSASKKVYFPPELPTSGDEVQSNLAENKAKLEESDPEWNEDRFLDTAETIFHTVQQAWTQNDLGISRPYLSDSIFTRFKKQLESLKRRKLKNVLENVVVGSTAIVKIEKDKDYDSITVKFRASMIDYKEDDKGNLVSGGKAQTPPFTEYWTFIRKAGTKTRETPTVKEKKCPNCGAPLKINESGRCEYCDANVVSGEFDWVLSKITQRDEWKA